jgi:hypothetical protein
MAATIYSCNDSTTCGFTTFTPARYGYKCPYCGEDLCAEMVPEWRRAIDGTTADSKE